VPWLEDDGVSKTLHLKTRGTSMSETPNDNIRRVKTFSTFILPLGASTSLDLLTPLRPEEDPK
jgi:hypothetical protein